MTTDCLLLPDFTCCEPEIVLKVKTNLGSQQVEIGKNTYVNQQMVVKFWFN